MAQAANKAWTGGGTTSNMSDAANWSPSGAPVNGDSLFFDGTTKTNVLNDLTMSSTLAMAGITFNAGAGPFTISGNAIYLSANVTNNSPNLQYFAATVEHNGAARWYNCAAGPMQFDNVNARSNGNNLIKDGPNPLTLSGTLDDNSTIAIVTNGVLICAKGGPSTTHAIGGTAPATIYTNGALRILSTTNNDQIYYKVRLNLLGGTLQMQALNTNEAIYALAGGASSSSSIVENGLANTTNLLQFGDGNNRKAIYNGIIRDGAAGVLNLEIYKQSMEQFSGTLTYSGTTTIDDATGAGASRLIINGSHIGAGIYSVFASAGQPTYFASLGGSGLISAPAIYFGANGLLSPGGSLSADADNATYSETAAILTISNAVVALTNATSTLDVQLNGTTAGSTYDQVNIVGTSGSFSNNSANLKLTLGYSPSAGDKFTIVQVQGTSPANNIGTFATLNGVTTDLSQGAIFVEPSSGKSFQISYRAEGSVFDAGAGNGNDIMLQVINPVGGKNLTWRGDGVNNNWDVTTTANWSTNGPSLTTFTNGDFVTFDDSGSNNIPVNLADALTPSTVLVNSTNDYVFGGTGYFTNTVVLTKTNTGTLSIVTDNGNVGSTIIQKGMLQVGTNGTTGTLSGTVTVGANGVLGYNHSDDKVISTAAFSGTGAFIHNGAGQLTVTADLSSSFTGNTTNSGALLQFGDGTGTAGQIGGTVYVPATNLLHYYFSGNANILNALGGNGTVNYEDVTGGTLTIATTAVSSNFTGTANLIAGIRVHASDHNQGYPFGNGSTVNVPIYSQAWLDRDDTGTYNNTFNIAGTGWLGATPQTGALSLFGCTLNGAVNLQANARIGGTISGGTILCPISGAYQLEVWGNAGSYVLSMGPTNGLHSYASTLITSGTVRALNTNAISTGPLTMDVAADFRLNGNSVMVANLSSINSGQVTGTGPTIQNISSTPATLTVGTDGTSTEFDGIFFNGGTGSLGLTKVGIGTLTLTAASTNTGTVSVNGGTLALSGSGSFNNAAVIAVGTSASYDVTAAGGTLTLNSGQTLKGSGTVTGNIVAGSGSTINPGDGVGTLTVTGNATLSGVLLMELNRTNTLATNDSLVVSGTLNAGGTLTVTNLGPALQVGDSFALFSAGVSGFAYNLETNDYVNNVKYTWNNTVSSDGKITVASVSTLVNVNPPQIQLSVSGNTLHLAWPTNAGWTLLTNSVALTATNQWFPYPNSANLTNADITLDPAKTNVFFRMVYPYP